VGGVTNFLYIEQALPLFAPGFIRVIGLTKHIFSALQRGLSKWLERLLLRANLHHCLNKPSENYINFIEFADIPDERR